MKTNTYAEMRKKHQKEISAFPIVYAFGDKQFKEAMQKLGLTTEDTDKVCTLFGAGDIIRKADVPAFMTLLERHHKEIADAIAADKTGNSFIFDMFNYELANYEYSYTEDASDALDALGITVEDLNTKKALLHGFKKAIIAQKSDSLY